MKVIFKLILILVILFFIYLYIFKRGGVLIKTDPENIDIIVNSQESDNAIVKEFAKGMKSNDYLKTINKKTEVIKQGNKKYQNVKYNFEKLLKYSDIEQIITDLNKSKIVTAEIIGNSVDNRNIYSIAIGKGSKHILFNGNIHAAEVANTMYIIKYIADFVNKYEAKDENIVKLLNDIKIIVVPSSNPDGYEACLFGVNSINNKKLYIFDNKEKIIFKTYKGNANGVDLNRNFPSQHGGLYYKDNELSEVVSSKPSIGYFDYYPGESLGSEPETKALMYWFNKYLENAYAFIDLHSAGRVIYSGKPNLSKSLNNDSNKLATMVNRINEYEAYGSEFEDVGYGNDGTATDYATEIASEFKFSEKTGRLTANQYQNPKVENASFGAITLESLEEYTFELSIIKMEYYDKNLAEAYTSLIESYK